MTVGFIWSNYSSVTTSWVITQRKFSEGKEADLSFVLKTYLIWFPYIWKERHPLPTGRQWKQSNRKMYLFRTQRKLYFLRDIYIYSECYSVSFGQHNAMNFLNRLKRAGRWFWESTLSYALLMHHVSEGAKYYVTQKLCIQWMQFMIHTSWNIVKMLFLEITLEWFRSPGRAF